MRPDDLHADRPDDKLVTLAVDSIGAIGHRSSDAATVTMSCPYLKCQAAAGVV